MAKTTRDKFDLFTLAVKQTLIGTEIIMEDGNTPEVKDFYCDYATNEIHIEFLDGSSGSFSLMDKYWVKIESTYSSVSSKKKDKKHRKK